MRCKGFTLVELLIVVSILGLLAALIFPAFAMVRERGRQGGCQSNERQIGLALFQYVQDYEGRLPSGTQLNTRAVAYGEGWAGQVFPYIKNAAVFRCPDDATVTMPPLAAVSYGLNFWPLVPASVRGRMARLPNPSKTVLLLEVSDDAVDLTRPDEGAAQGASVFSSSGDGDLLCSGPHGVMGRGKYATGWLAGISPTMSYSSGPKGRHNDGSNFLLCDGHVKWLPPAQVLPNHRVSSQQEFDSYAASFTGQYYPSPH